MKTIKFNSDETFDLWCALRIAINHEIRNLYEWEDLNKEGGYKSIIEDTKNRIEILRKVEDYVKCYKEIKIEGD